MDIAQIEIWLNEAFIILIGVLWLIQALFKRDVDESKTHENAGFVLPIAWMIFGAFWIYLRSAGVVALPW